MKITETSVENFFARYERLFNLSLEGRADIDEITALYTRAFIAATPAGVMAGENDAAFRQALAHGHGHYRAIGTQSVRVLGVHVSAIDDHHCLAHVNWRTVYAREGRPEVTIDFDVHYFLRTLEGEPKVFGWVSGDEQALLHAHGLI